MRRRRRRAGRGGGAARAIRGNEDAWHRLRRGPWAKIAHESPGASPMRVLTLILSALLVGACAADAPAPAATATPDPAPQLQGGKPEQIGRASCRERV